MPDQQSTLTACLQKARELRITDGFGLFILTKLPAIHEYRLVNCALSDSLRLWLHKQTHLFVCIIDSMDILLIDSALPFTDLHDLITRCEYLKPDAPTCLDLTELLDLLKEQMREHQTPIPN